jgi:hypothetical protein
VILSEFGFVGLEDFLDLTNDIPKSKKSSNPTNPSSDKKRTMKNPLSTHYLWNKRYT